MGIILNQPRYPVIDPNPSFIETVSNLNLDDLVKVTTAASGSTAFGYLAGLSVMISCYLSSCYFLHCYSVWQGFVDSECGADS